jgi:3-oxoacyl-[acyl-carrier-protein] synthase-3
MSSAAYLRAFGSYVPEHLVDNAALAARTGRTPEVIEKSTGIVGRRYAAPDQSVADLGLAAAQDCLTRAGVEASAVGLILFASGSSERCFPGPAATLAAQLGLAATPAIDLPIASAGSLIGMALAADLVARYGNVLVVAAEIMSRRITDADPDTAILFGDGAGACLLSRDSGPTPAIARIADLALYTDGNFADSLTLAHGGTLAMRGLEVIMQASRKVPRAIADLLAKNNIAADDVQVFLMHQANRNLLAKIAKELKVPEDRFFSNIASFGNTSSASLLIAAKQWSDAASVTGPVVFAAFGAGLQWGALLAVPVES